MTTENTIKATLIRASESNKTNKVESKLSAAARVLSSFAGKEEEYKTFMQSVMLDGLNLRVIKDILHFFPTSANETVAQKVARGLEISAAITKLSYELDSINSDLKAFASAVIDAWNKANDNVSSLKLVPSEENSAMSVLITSRNSFSVDKSKIAALKVALGETSFSDLFKEEETYVLKNGEFKKLAIAALCKMFGDNAVDILFTRNVDVKVVPETYKKLTAEDSKLDAETLALLNRVVTKAEPSVKYPK